MPEAIPFFDVDKVMLQQISQSLLEAQKMGRSLENAADAVLPLTDNVTVRELLKRISDGGKQSSDASRDLYRLIAREAAKP